MILETSAPLQSPDIRPFARPDYGPKSEVTERQVQNPASGPVVSGAFYATYKDNDGNTFLQGGQVTGGNGSYYVEDLKVIDHDSGPIATSGFLILILSGTGIAIDGVLMPGFDLDNPKAPAPSINLGINALPTATSLTGSTRIVLGAFTETNFMPSGSGHINIRFCIGGFIISRF